MFFSKTGHVLSLLGVFRLERDACQFESQNDRSYDSISIRKEGCASFYSAGQSYTVDSSSLLYIPEAAPYSQSTLGETIYAIHFVNYSKCSISLEQLHIEDPQQALDLIEEMWLQWERKDIGYQYRCSAMLYRLLEMTYRQCFNQQLQTVTSENRLSYAIDYMYKNFRNSSLTVRELSQVSHYSEVYFRELFISLFGMSPKKYILNLRMEYAEQLLRSQLYNIQDVAQMCGFTDPKHFSDSFRKKYGVSPRVYRNQAGQINTR